MDGFEFVSKLSEYRNENVFNPWGEFDKQYDFGVEAPVVRRNNLMTYLALRKKVDYIVMAEALGYQGGHFSGIALTCERMLLGYHEVPVQMVVGDYISKRTSNPVVLKGIQKRQGFNEPTDTVVWSSILEQGWDPFRVVMWNIFPFHPHRQGEMLSNRTPSREELLDGYKYFQLLRLKYPKAKIVAIGRKCRDILAEFNVKCFAVRHPSNGGVNEFKEQMRNL